MKAKKLKHINFTAIIEKSEDGWYVGQLEELPEVISQGKKFIRRKLSFAR